MKSIKVRVKPNSRCNELIEPVEDEFWIARIKSPPVDGKANRELIALVAKHFCCQKKDVSIRHGDTSRIKLIKIQVD